MIFLNSLILHPTTFIRMKDEKAGKKLLLRISQLFIALREIYSREDVMYFKSQFNDKSNQLTLIMHMTLTLFWCAINSCWHFSFDAASAHRWRCPSCLATCESHSWTWHRPLLCLIYHHLRVNEVCSISRLWCMASYDAEELVKYYARWKFIYFSVVLRVGCENE